MLKKAVLALVIFIFLSPLSGAGEIRTHRAKFTFSSDDLDIDRVEAYDLPRLRGEGIYSFARTGYPLLPIKVFKVLAPAGSKVRSVQIITETSELPGVYEVFPAQPQVPMSGKIEPFHEGEPSIYGSEGLYPAQCVWFSDAGTIRGQTAFTFEVSPLQWDPKTGRMVLNENVEFAINVEYSRPPYIPERNKAFFRTLSNVYSNRDEYLEEATGPVMKAMGPLSSGTVRCLIITSEEMSGAFWALSEHRTDMGLPAEIVTDWSSYSGNDDQEKIQSMIRHYVNNKGTVYVLLGGDENAVPVRRCIAESDSVTISDLPVDLYYACLDNDWDLNGNGVFGEYLDHVDREPDVHVGRISLSGIDDAALLAYKIIDFEENASNASRFGNMLSAGAELWNTYTAGLIPSWVTGHDPVSDAESKSENLFDLTLDNTWTGTRYRLYDTFSDYDSVNAGDYDLTTIHLAEKLSGGIGHFFMATHGHPVYFELEYGGQFHLDNLSLLSPAGGTFTLYTPSCHTCRYDGDNAESCLAEGFLAGNLAGAAAYVGSTRTNWGNPLTGGIDGSAGFQNARAFYDEMMNSSSFRIGGVFSGAKVRMVPFLGTSKEMRWVQHSVVLLGDPCTPLYTEIPGTFSPNHPGNVTTISQNVLVETGVAGSLVCLRGCGVYEYGTADSVGDFNCTVDADCGGVIKVTISGKNRFNYRGAIEVIDGAGGGPSQQASGPVPADGSDNVSRTITLSWADVENASLCRVFIGRGVCQPLLVETAGNSAAVTDLEYYTTYYWRVDAVNSYGVNAGEVWSFRTEDYIAPPGKAMNPDPADMEADVDLISSLSWTAADNATSYVVYFGKPSIPPLLGNTSSTSINVSGLDYGTQYYWRVDSMGPGGVTTGDTWRFTVEPKSSGGGGGCSMNPGDSIFPAGAAVTLTLLLLMFMVCMRTTVKRK